jgi:hypothetical protein
MTQALQAGVSRLSLRINFRISFETVGQPACRGELSKSRTAMDLVAQGNARMSSNSQFINAI